MSIPTALAPTAILAAGRINKWVDRLIGVLGPTTLVEEIYRCRPCVHEVTRIGSPEETWLEASWRVEILTGHFSTARMDEIRDLSSVIDVDEIVVQPRSKNRIFLRFTISARVMRC